MNIECHRFYDSGAIFPGEYFVMGFMANNSLLVAASYIMDDYGSLIEVKQPQGVYHG